VSAAPAPNAVLDAGQRCTGELAAFASRGCIVRADGPSALCVVSERASAGVKDNPGIDFLWTAVTEPLDLAALRLWLAQAVPALPPPPAPVAPGKVRCPECKGTGHIECTCECGHEHEAECDGCDGAGTIEEELAPDPDPTAPVCIVRILGVYFDARILARAVAAMPGDAARWGRVGSAHDEWRPLKIEGDGWWYALMPRRPDGNGTPDSDLGGWPER
jgi:hypothetical protein